MRKYRYSRFIALRFDLATHAWHVDEFLVKSGKLVWSSKPHMLREALEFAAKWRWETRDG